MKKFGALSLLTAVLLSSLLTEAQQKCAAVFTEGAKGTTFFAAAEQVPQLLQIYQHIGVNMSLSSPPIQHPREIPFMKNSGFRELEPWKMKARADQLPPPLQEAITTAYNAFVDSVEMTAYLKDLFVESAEWMIYRNRGKDLSELFKDGVSESAMAQVLVRRLKAEGETFTTVLPRARLSYGREEVDEAALATDYGRFREAVRLGPFIDRTFGKAPKAVLKHGRYTHMLQRDYIKKIFQKKFGEDQKIFWEFLGTKKGIHWWVDVFDSADPGTFSSPERLNIYVYQTFSGWVLNPRIRF